MCEKERASLVHLSACVRMCVNRSSRSRPRPLAHSLPRFLTCAHARTQSVAHAAGWVLAEVRASERERARARARERERALWEYPAGHTRTNPHARTCTAGSSTSTTSRERSWRSMATPSSKWKRTARRALRKANESALDYRARPMLRRPMRRLPTLSKQRT